jgi:hypothetical protein
MRFTFFMLLIWAAASWAAPPVAPDTTREESRFWQEIAAISHENPQFASAGYMPVDTSASVSQLFAGLQRSRKFVWSLVDSLYAVPNLEDCTGLSFEFLGPGVYTGIRLLRQRLDQLEVKIRFDEYRRHPADSTVRAALDSAMVHMRESARLSEPD